MSPDARVADHPVELSTVGADFAVFHRGVEVLRHDGLTPATSYEVEGHSFTTLPDLGELLCRLATVNDVHFGELECGRMGETGGGPIFTSEGGEPPYPEMMSRAAAAEMAAVDPDLVVVKGDLTSHGTMAEYEAFREAYDVFPDLMVVRGNHESYHGLAVADRAVQVRELPGARVVVLDTSIDGSESGTVTADQLDELSALGHDSDRPVLVFGHHHLGNPDSRERADHDFGIDLDASARFRAVVAATPRLAGYFCGHTHRNRVRRFADTGTFPWAEVACVKDYPGTWAEYRVHERGVLQIAHRISTPEALRWSEKTRAMFDGLYHAYALGTLADRCFAVADRS